MAILTGEQILATPDVQREVVKVPEWGGEVLIQTVMSIHRDVLQEQLKGEDGKVAGENYTAKVVAACAINEAGQLLFTPEEVEALGRKSGRALARVFKKCMELNAMSDEAMEEIRGNSPDGQNSDSRTA